MTKINILRSDAYRMVDALRDYADILHREAVQYGHGDSMAEFARSAAERIEHAPHVGYGLLEIERYDLDAAHSAVIGVMTRHYEKAQLLRDEAEVREAKARRLESFLDAFTVAS